MKKFFIGLLILASAAGAQVVYSHLSGLALDADGSVSEPALMFGQDSDTGIYRVTTNTLGIAVGGSQVFRATTLELSIASDGTPAWKINGVTQPITGISKKLTTDSYKLYAGVLSEGAANKTGTLGYIEIDVAK